MQNRAASFEKIFNRWNWKPIRGCPGRYILAGGTSSLTPADIAGEPGPVLDFCSDAAADRVFVLEFADGGGLISYHKGENLFLHTLNSPDGFRRKLEQLRSAPEKM